MVINVPVYMYKKIAEDFKPAYEKIQYPIAEIRKGYNTYKEYLYVWRK